MGVEEIIAVIDREAREEATRIVEEAERQAAALIADAESGVRAQVDAASSEAMTNAAETFLRSSPSTVSTR